MHAYIHTAAIIIFFALRKGFVEGMTGGHYIYEKNFQVLAEDVKKHYTFYFEGVYKNAEVYLNDQKTGQGGYRWKSYIENWKS